MICDLSADQWHSVTHGRLTGPDERTYLRRTTRSKRADVDALIAAGGALVQYWYGGEQLDWHDGPDAAGRWAELRRDVITNEMRPTRRGQLQWHAGSWEANDGAVLVLLTAHC